MRPEKLAASRSRPAGERPLTLSSLKPQLGHLSVKLGCLALRERLKEGRVCLPRAFSAEQPIAAAFDGRLQWRGNKSRVPVLARCEEPGPRQ